MTKFDQFVDPLILETRKGQEDALQIESRELKKEYLLLQSLLNEDESFAPGNAGAVSIAASDRVKMIMKNLAVVDPTSQYSKALVNLFYFIFLSAINQQDQDIEISDSIDMFNTLKILVYQTKFDDPNVKRPVHIKQLSQELYKLFGRVFPESIVKIDQGLFHRLLQKYIRSLESINADYKSETRKLVSQKLTKLNPFRRYRFSPLDSNELEGAPEYQAQSNSLDDL